MFYSQNLFSQEFVIWNNPIANTTSAIGNTNSGVTVTASRVGLNNNLTFQSSTNNMLRVYGPYPLLTTVPADDLQFIFSQPVIVTRLIMSDIQSLSGGWNDSFNFNNILFNNHLPLNPSSTDNGVHLITGAFLPQTTWFCSNVIPQGQGFNLSFFLTNDFLTTAWLNYTVEIIRVPIIAPICLNSTPMSLTNITIGNNIQGTWTPSIIDTSTSGNFVYTFTPNTGQALNCPIPINVQILPPNDPGCCINQLTLTSGIDDMNNLTVPITTIHREASDWISATNYIGVGDNSFQNGVVYHAGNFVELNPGFEAVTGSQFVSYIQGCTDPTSFVYKEQNKINEEEIKSIVVNKELSVFPNPSNNSIEIVMKGNTFNNITIASIDGKIVLDKKIKSNDSVQIDISYFTNGMYFVNILSDDGHLYTKKIIKN